MSRFAAAWERKPEPDLQWDNRFRSPFRAHRSPELSPPTTAGDPALGHHLSNYGVFPQITAGAPSAVQRVCDNCDDLLCNNGSKCGVKTKASKKKAKSIGPQNPQGITKKTQQIQAAKKKPQNVVQSIKSGGNGRNKYTSGTHGYKKSEQKRLSALYNIAVTGDSHESEHTVGFEPLNQTSGNKRGKGADARALENFAPAYQEIKEQHRDNIGTGTHSTADASGFNSEQYRNSQRSFLEQGNASIPVQLNQLTYAHQPGFSTVSQTPQGQAATDSFGTMVGGMGTHGVTYAQGNATTNVPVSQNQQAEMLAARQMAMLQRNLTPMELGAIYKQVGNTDIDM